MELKPCPFCGSDDVAVNLAENEFGKQVYFVGCFSCNTCGPDSTKRETADVVEVVRCKDCWKRYDIDECPMCSLHFLKYTDYTEDDGFCDRGERRSHHDSLCDQTEEGEHESD